MRTVTLALIALACLATCASKPKVATRAAAPRPLPPPTLRLTSDGPTVAYAVPAGWLAMPAEKPVEPVVLVRPNDKDDAIALVLQETDLLHDKLEEVTTRWAMMAATMVHDFHATDLDAPTYPSDGESSFTIRGQDAAGRNMLLSCRIKNVGSPTTDFWVIVMLTGRSDQAQELTEIGDTLMKSLHVQASEPPK